jgi:membrane-anchored protein YejM (alkaline phosphatase superfamily)
LFVFLQTLVLVVLGSRFSTLLGPEPWWVTAYLQASWYLFIGTVGMLVATAFRLFVPMPIFGLLVAAAAAAPVTAYFMLDFPYYAAFRMHAGELAYRLAEAGATHPAVAPFGWAHLRELAAYTLGFEILLALLALRLSYGGVRIRFPGPAMVAGALLVFAADRAFAAKQAYEGRHWFTGQTEAFPLYVNLTATGLFASFEPRPPYTAYRRTQVLPGMPLTTYANAATEPIDGPKPNILFVLVESWRRDALNADDMPRLWALRHSFTVAEKHVSGGNSTRPGLYALFYALDHRLSDRLLAEKRGPYLFKRLLTEGYDVHVFGSEPLDFLGTRESVFIDVDRFVEDALYYRPSVSDYMAYRKASAVLASRSPAPFFNFVFFAATHAKYHAFPGMEPVQPVATNLSSAGYLETHHAETHNRYRNALRLTDELIARLVDQVARRPDAKNTLIVITGDHGEEFWEHGHFTHSNAFDEEQTAVPMLIRFPGQATGQTITHLTSHYDVAPTLLAALNDPRPVADYADGRLLTSPPAADVLQSNWNVYSLFDGAARITFPGGSLNFLRPVEVTDDHGAPLPLAPYVAAHRERILSALERGARFYPHTL